MKKINETDKTKLEGHSEEFHILHALKHKNIVKEIELFVNEVKGIVYIVLEYVSGAEMH